MNEWYATPAEAQQFAGPASNPDRYTLEEIVSQGMEGRLWRSSLAVDGHRFQVAVKEIHQRNVSSLDEWFERWERQAELLRSLDHPGLVRVREVFQGSPAHRRGQASTNERSLFLVMNWASGDPLDVWSRPRNHSERVAVLSQVAAAVDHLHSGADTNGVAVLHRDIKPQNIIVDEGGRPRLVDFGFARLADGADYTVVGSAHYMAPEVPLGAAPTPATDRYSFGCVAYTVLSGQRVDPGDPDQLRRTVDSIEADGLPAELAGHLRSLLDREPGSRPPDLGPWQRLSAGAAATPAAVDVVDETATVLRRPGWLPPTESAPGSAASTSSPGSVVTGPPTLPSAAVPPSQGAATGWSATQWTSFDPHAPPPGPPPDGTTTLSPESFDEPRRHWAMGLAVGLVAAAIVIGAVAFAVWFTGRSDPDPTTTTTTPTSAPPPTPTPTPAPPTSAAPVVVPNVVGMRRDDVEALLTQLGLRSSWVYAEDQEPADEVLSVVPAVGTTVEAGTEVRITVSSPTFTMPDLRGSTLGVAQAQLTRLGHMPGFLSVSPAGPPAGSLVTAQVPAPGATPAKDGSVLLSVLVPVTPTTSPSGDTATPTPTDLPPPTSAP